jgi:HEAT repeat protein
MNDFDASERAIRNDHRSTADLISAALTATDEDAAWDIITVLQHRGTREVLDAAAGLCDSDCPKERELAADILGQSRVRETTFHEESVSLLLGLLEREEDAAVLSATLSALGQRREPRAISAILCWGKHPDAAVRLSVVFALLAHTDERAVNALIDLSADEDEAVRDWATFGLGSQIDTDTPAIRHALFQRLADSDATVRGEALIGLARRKDERVLPLLIQELGREDVSDLALEAAGEMGHPCLLPALVRLKERDGSGASCLHRSYLQSALDRCRGGCEGA